MKRKFAMKLLDKILYKIFKKRIHRFALIAPINLDYLIHTETIKFEKVCVSVPYNSKIPMNEIYRAIGEEISKELEKRNYIRKQTIVSGYEPPEIIYLAEIGLKEKV